MKRGMTLLLALLLAVGLACPALAIADKPENGYVGDYAGVLRADTVSYILERDEKLTAATGGAIVIVSVDFMDGMDAESYAKACFDAWGVGDAKKNNGLLLVYAVGENRVWAMPGRGIASDLSASVLNGLLEDAFYDDYDAGEYDRATRAFFDGACGWYESHYGVDLDRAEAGGTGGQGQAAGAGRDEWVRKAVLVLIILVVVLLVVLADRARYRRYVRRESILPGYAVYHPFLFGRTRRRTRRPRGPRPPQPPRRTPPRSGGSGGFGGGAGRSAGDFSGRSSGRSSSRSSGRSSSRPSGRPSSRPSGGFGGRSGGFGGGATRGGGAGRR